MLSRIGESLYWMARNLERADNTARIGTGGDGAVEARMAALRAHLSDTTPQAILDQGLHEYVDWFLVLLANLTDALQADYFEAHLGDLA